MGEQQSKENIDEQRYRVLIDNAPEVVLILDTATGRFIDANQAAIDLLGFSRAELLKLGPTDISPALLNGQAANKVAREHIETALTGGNPFFEWVHIDRSGQEIPCEIRLIRFPPYDQSIIRASIIDVSDKKKIEATLAESEERLQLALKATGLGCYDYFPKEGRLLWDARMHELFGLDPSSDIDRGEFYWEAIHEDDIERVTSILQSIMAPNSDQSTFEYKYRIIRDNKVMYLASTGAIIRDGNGEVERFIGTIQDITGLVETEKKLNKTLDQLQLAVKTAELGVWQHNLVTNQLESNDRLLEIYGVDSASEDLSRKSWREHIHPEDKEAVSQDLTKLFAGETLTNSIFRAVLPNGKIRYIQAAANPIFDEEGNLAELIGINIDITSIKKNAEALREREAFHRAIYDNSLNGVLVVDDQGELRSFNQAACQILGFSEKELTNLSLTDLPITNVGNRSSWFEAIRKKSKEIGELVIARPDQSNCITQYNLVRVEKDFNLWVLVDITDRKQAEIQLQESEEKFSKSFHASPTPMLLVDFASRTILDVNKAHTELTGFYPEEIIDVSGKLGFRTLPTQGGNSLRGALALIEQQDRLSNYELTIHSKTGIKQSVLAFAEPLDVQGRHLHIVTIVNISDRKAAEEAVRQARDYAESLIEAANVMVVSLDPSGTVTVFNQAAQEITGYHQEDLFGKNWFETLVPRERYPEVWKVFEELEEKGELARTFENPILTKKGEERIISWQNSVLYDHGAPAGTISFGVDVTERKAMEEALRDREERFRTVFNQQFQFMAILTPEGRFLEVNDLSLRVVGVAQEDVLGSFFWDAPAWAQLPEWQEIIKDLILKAGQTRETLLTELVFLTVPGEERWADTSFTAILDEADELQYILVQASDITERKQAQENLLQAQQELSELANRFKISTRAAQLGIWDWQILKDQLIWDETMMEIYGLRQKQLPNRIEEWQRYLLEEDRAIFQEMIDWTSSGEKELNSEFRIQRPDGAIRHIKAVASVQRNEDGKAIGMIGANWDVTQEKEAEQERIRAHQLELRNRELEQFAYVASHDLQEPLRSVISFVGLLKRNYRDQLDERASEYIQFVVEASSRMSQLIKGLLEYSRIGTNRELSLVDSAAMVQQILNDLSTQISSTGAVIDVAPLPQIKGYETELRMLFQNLISNAIKFCKEDQRPHIRIGVKEEKKTWIFSVADEGIGIAPMYQEQIFALFQRLHGREEYEGTGIGLAHCQKIADLHGGTIWVESELEKGSTFYFSISKSEKDLD